MLGFDYKPDKNWCYSFGNLGTLFNSASAQKFPPRGINLRGKTSGVGYFLEAIRHIRQTCVRTTFRLQVLDSSRLFSSDNEIPKFDVCMFTNTRVFIVGTDELFLLAKTNFYLRC